MENSRSLVISTAFNGLQCNFAVLFLQQALYFIAFMTFGDESLALAWCHLKVSSCQSKFVFVHVMNTSPLRSIRSNYFCTLSTWSWHACMLQEVIWRWRVLADKSLSRQSLFWPLSQIACRENVYECEVHWCHAFNTAHPPHKYRCCIKNRLQLLFNLQLQNQQIIMNSRIHSRTLFAACILNIKNQQRSTRL